MAPYHSNLQGHLQDQSLAGKVGMVSDELSRASAV